ncbi:RNA helicase [beta proteobacterium AAP51]|nr:RNA helicase [beta proteobacterium AAP51]
MTTPDFSALGLAPALVRTAAAAGWLRPSPVQAAALPAVLAGRDVLVQAPTGAGKTGAFLLPLLQQLLAQPGAAEARPRRLHALVLAPTRELAAQTAAAAQALAPQFKTVVAVGGLSINPQMMALRGGAHLLVATPGRLLDLTRQNAVRVADAAVLVLDEADRLLDEGFADETRRVLALMPRQRQTLLFSATLPPAVQQLAQAVQRDALCLQVAAQMPAHGAPVAEPAAALAAAAADADGDTLRASAIHQRAIVVDTARRTALLRHLLKTEAWPRTLVFVATQYACEHVAAKLKQGGVAALAFHGQLSPARRTEALAALQAGRAQVVVATDVAARGIDIPGLAVVVNHDLPRAAADHVHRIGRTGRAGAAGLAVSLVLADAPGSEAHFRLIEKRQGLRVPRETVAGFEPAAGAALLPLPPDARGGIKGRRKSKKDKLREAAAAAGATSP